MKEKLTVEDMVEPFKLFDNNGSGLMNVIALEHIIKNLGDVLTDEVSTKKVNNYLIVF